MKFKTEVLYLFSNVQLVKHLLPFNERQILTLLWQEFMTCFVTKATPVSYTVYVVQLANIKFGELECNANWWAFSLANRGIV